MSEHSLDFVEGKNYIRNTEKPDDFLSPFPVDLPNKIKPSKVIFLYICCLIALFLLVQQLNPMFDHGEFLLKLLGSPANPRLKSVANSTSPSHASPPDMGPAENPDMNRM